MPLPPEGDAATEALEGGVSLEFSRVECLLYTFHQLAKQHTDFLTGDPQRLKDFRIRSVITPYTGIRSDDDGGSNFFIFFFLR